MPTLKYLEQTYDCEVAIKGSDYIHLLDDNGCMVASFDGITDFSAFTLQNGSYTTPTADHDCHIAVIRDDGTIGKGGHTCSGVASKTHSHAWSDVTDKPTTFTPATHGHAATDITSGILSGERGGTGSSTCFTNAGANAILKKASDGNNMWYTNTANGALYATAANGLAKFGTLPVAQGGTGQTSLANLRTAMNAGQFQYTSYVGTGGKSNTNPCSLTFNFVPRIVIIVMGGTITVGTNDSAVGILANGDSTYAVLYYNNASSVAKRGTVTWSGNTVSWYDSSADDQFNCNSLTYRVYAWG